MSDSTTTEPTVERDADLGEAGKKALEAERAARKAAEREAADYKGRLEAAETAHAAALTAAQAALTEAQGAAATANLESLRWKAAATHKLDVDDVSVFLTGADEDVISQQAERLAALASKGETQGPTTPKPDATQGATGEPAATSTGAQFAAAVESAFN